MEKTLVLIKPDAVAKHYTGDIIKKYEEAGFRILAMKLLRMSQVLAKKHYAEHVGRPYYDDLEGFITSGPLVAMVLAGDDVVAAVRKLNGKTDPKEAEEGTIRKRFAASKSRNAVHASDSQANAEREIHIFFNEIEILD
jgi:nucleoside-diphosphate kinase